MTHTDELKNIFAKEFLKNSKNPFQITSKLFPGQFQAAYVASMEWPNDPVVLAAMQSASVSDDDADRLPTRADLAELLWARMKSAEPEDLAKLAKVYAEVRGFIEKPNNTANVNVYNNRVMLVKDHGDDAQWEQAAINQQRSLINGDFTKYN